MSRVREMSAICTLCALKDRDKSCAEGIEGETSTKKGSHPILLPTLVSLLSIFRSIRPPVHLRTVEHFCKVFQALQNHSLVDWVRTLMGSSFPGSTLSWSMIPADTGVSLSNASCRLMVDDTFSSVQKQSYRSKVRTTGFTVQRFAKKRVEKKNPKKT